MSVKWIRRFFILILTQSACTAPLGARKDYAMCALPKLHEAVCAGDPVVIKSLLRDVDPDVKDANGQSALHHAAERNAYGIVMHLLAWNADPNMQDINGFTPLHVAAARGHVETTRVLLECSGPNIKDRDQSTLVRIADSISSLFQSEKPLQCIKVDTICCSGRTALSHAVIHRCSAIVELLLAHGAIANLPDFYGRTALHYAAIRGDAVIADILMNQKQKQKQHTANPSARDEHGMEPIHYASTTSNDLLLFLLRTGNLNARDCQQRTPLHHAAQGGKVDAINILFDCRAEIDAVDCNKCTPLMLACQRGHTDAVALLFARGASSGMTDACGRTILHHAAQSGEVGVASLLTAENDGVLNNVNATDGDGMTPLHMSVLHGHAHMAAFLESRGAMDTPDSFGMTPADYVAMRNDTPCTTTDTAGIFCYMAANGHTALVRKLLAHGVSPESRDAALHLAAQHGHQEIIAALLSSGVTISNQNTQMETPLHRAVLHGHVDAVIALVHGGASVALRDALNRTPLDCAVHGGYSSIVRVLLERADCRMLPLVQTAAEKGHAAAVFVLLQRATDFDTHSSAAEALLCNAASAGHTEVVSVLLHRGVRTCQRVADAAAIQLAASGNHHQTVKILLQNGADPNVHTMRYWRPLTYSISCGNFETAKLLVEWGASIDAQYSDGQNSLDFAVARDNYEMLEFMLERSTQHERLYRGDALLLNAARWGHTRLIPLILRYSDCINVGDREGRTALHYAAEYGHVNTVAMLLNHGAIPNAKDKKKFAPLHFAAHEDIVVALLSREANVNAFNHDYRTPLHYAAKRGHVKTVVALLNGGADPNISYGSDTPLDLAIRGGRYLIVTILLERGATAKTNYLGRYLSGRRVRADMAKALQRHFVVDSHIASVLNWSPLHVAAAKGNIETVEKLASVATVCVRDAFGSTPLHCAAFYGHVAIAERLLKKGASPYAVDHAGQAPLHDAARNGHADVIELFAAQNFSLTEMDLNKLTPFCHAAQNGHVDAMACLISHGAGPKAREALKRDV